MAGTEIQGTQGACVSSAASAAVLVVDMQNDAVERFVKTGRDVIEPIARVLESSRKGGFPIVYNVREHRASGVDVEKFRLEAFSKDPFLVHGTRGADVVDRLRPCSGDYIVSKHRFDGFYETDLQTILAGLGVRRLIVVGIQTQFCVRETVVGAVERGYDVTVLSDAVTTDDPAVHAANLHDMRNMGAEVMTVEEYLRLAEKYRQ